VVDTRRPPQTNARSLDRRHESLRGETDSPTDGASAGCPGGPTPFNGDHTAGIQVLDTSNFPDLAGPLSQLQ
jgi:hypothetical protein